MKHFSALLSRLQKIKDQHGFTMIELLIVISILGILAVAVLSAINPVEQINRGRDTGTRSDAEQLLSAIDRFNAFQGYFPWQEDANDDTGRPLALVGVTDTTPTVTLDPGAVVCPTLLRLSTGVTPFDVCIGSQELKASFVTRITTSASSRNLYVYNNGNQGDSTYVCFVPQSGAFIQEATARCVDDVGAGLPDDVEDTVKIEICDPAAGTVITEVGQAICLP